MIYDGLRHQPRCAWATVIKTRKQEWIHWIFSSSKVSAFKKRAFPYACAYGCSFGYKFTPVRTRRLSTTMLPSKLTPYVASLLGRARYSNLTPSSILVIFRRTMIQILLEFVWYFQAHDVSSIKCSQPLTGRYVTLQVEVEHFNFWSTLGDTWGT